MILDFNNVFIANISFGNSFSYEIVLAKDKKEAIEAIEDYYAEPEITELSSLEEILVRLNKFKINKDLVIVEELDLDEKGKLFIRFSEEFGDLKKIKELYNHKQAVLFNKDSAELSVLNLFFAIKNGDFYPIISESYI